LSQLLAATMLSRSHHLPLCPHFFSLISPPPPRSTLFPYTTLFRSRRRAPSSRRPCRTGALRCNAAMRRVSPARGRSLRWPSNPRSEEHTSELQSRFDLVCRLLLEKKKNKTFRYNSQPRTHRTTNKN